MYALKTIAQPVKLVKAMEIYLLEMTSGNVVEPLGHLGVTSSECFLPNLRRFLDLAHCFPKPGLYH